MDYPQRMARRCCDCLLVGVIAAVATTGCKRAIASIAKSDLQSASTVGGFLVATDSPAASSAASLKSSGDGSAQTIELIAKNTVGVWYIGAASGDVQSQAQKQATAALAADATALIVAYNIPNRDCGGASAGGTTSDQYPDWIGKLAAGIGNAKAFVVLEPDALAVTDCLSDSDRAARFSLLAGAVKTLKGQPNTKVYIDAGHAKLLSVSDAAARLQQAGISQADGFALNVANYIATEDTAAYGRQVKAIVGKGFLIDTSRNGAGDNGEWCNPSGRGIGTISTMSPQLADVDALAWVQTPGMSDGPCNGGPAAGNFWPSRAVEMANAVNFTGIPDPSDSAAQGSKGSGATDSGGAGGSSSTAPVRSPSSTPPPGGSPSTPSSDAGSDPGFTRPAPKPVPTRANPTDFPTS